MIINDWMKPKSNNDRIVMMRNAQYTRIIIMCSYVIVFSTVILFVIITGLGYNLTYVNNITGTAKPLPIPGYYPYNVSASPQFELTFVVQFLTLLICIPSYNGVDIFLALLIFHICGQLENLSTRVYHMRNSNNFIKILKFNVLDHIRIIKYVAIIEDAYTIMLLLIFVIFGVMFCGYGFLLITVIFEDKNVSIKRIILLLLLSCTAIAHMCIYCVVGDLLVKKYEKVYNAVYKCEWYTLDTKEAKNLILLIVCMNKPLHITIGKILPMTMSTFCNILKTSGGYISVLLANRN